MSNCCKKQPPDAIDHPLIIRQPARGRKSCLNCIIERERLLARLKLILPASERASERTRAHRSSCTMSSRRCTASTHTAADLWPIGVREQMIHGRRRQLDRRLHQWNACASSSSDKIRVSHRRAHEWTRHLLMAAQHGHLLRLPTTATSLLSQAKWTLSLAT